MEALQLLLGGVVAGVPIRILISVCGSLEV